MSTLKENHDRVTKETNSVHFSEETCEYMGAHEYVANRNEFRSGWHCVIKLFQKGK